MTYGPEDEQFGFLYLPPAPGPHPVVVMVHGGFWRAEIGLEYLHIIAELLRAEGIAIWSLEYRRLGNPGGGWPGTFRDLVRAEEMLPELSREYDLDTDRTILFGHSSGGHLALWLAGRHRLSAGTTHHRAERSPYRGVVALAPIPDLTAAYAIGPGDLRETIGTLMGGPPERFRDRYQRYSPSEFVPTRVRQLIVHGSQDQLIPISLSEDYVTKARAAGDRVGLIPIPDAGHFEPIDPREQAWESVERAIHKMLGT